MITFDTLTRAQALDALFQNWRFQSLTEQVPLAEACGRVLAESQYSKHALPVVRASILDGIGVISSQFVSGIPDTSQWTLGVDYVRADTGDDFDDRFDAVIPIEDITFDERHIPHISPEAGITEGAKIRRAGSILQKGDPLMEKNLPIRPADLTALGMGGIWNVPVYQKPRVAFIPVGSELIPVGEALTRGKTTDTNSLMVEHTLKEMGARPMCYPIVKDDSAAILKALRKALEESDIVILNGGSSKGDEDYNTRLIRSEGRLLFHGVAAAPGRPLSIGIVREKPVVNISGPTLATFFGLDWLIRPIVSRCLSVPSLQRPKVKGVLMEDLFCSPLIELFCRVHVCRTDEGGYAIYPRTRDNATAAETMTSNAMFIAEIGDGVYEKGSLLEVELLRSEEYIK
jgi:molybdopterin molybdotransferase/putative molybdopterin biosynthesis protein